MTKPKIIPLDTHKVPDNFVSIVEAAHAQSLEKKRPVRMSYNEIALIIDARQMDSGEAVKSAKEAHILADIRAWLGLSTYSDVKLGKAKMHEHFNSLKGTTDEQIDQLLQAAAKMEKYATGEIDGIMVIAAPSDDKTSIHAYMKASRHEDNQKWRTKARNWPKIAAAIRLS